jgi:anthranilate phosphoribosyltransferase
MIELRDILERLLQRRDLDEAEAGELLVALTDASVAPAMAGALLAALRFKGITPDEVRGFASAMRSLARRPQLPPGPPAIDIVGTGGDSSGSFNLSTAAALLVAAIGVRVVKHGNRSVSSRSGSADLLEALGLPMPLDERAAGDCLAATGFTFLFAPYYHPAMKEVAPVRRALGVRTVFNLLGPLTNPAEPPFSLIGAYSTEAARLMADTLAGMPIGRAFVIHGEPGWDEATPVGPFELYDVRPGRVTREVRDPRDLGIQRCTAADLYGGDAQQNATALRAVFEGRDQGPHCDAVVLNAALALEVIGVVPSVEAGVVAAIGTIRSGDAVRLLERLAAFGRGQGTGDRGQ